MADVGFKKSMIRSIVNDFGKVVVLARFDPFVHHIAFPFPPNLIHFATAH